VRDATDGEVVKTAVDESILDVERHDHEW